MKRFGIIATFTALLLTGSLTAAEWSGTKDFESPVVIESSVQDEFTEVETDELPEKVKTTVSEEYEDYKIDKAYVNSVKIYKLKLKNDDGVETVYIDESGKELEI